MRFRYLLPLLTLLASPAGAETIFRCAIGQRLATVTLEGDSLTYTYGRAGRPEIRISGGPSTGNLSYHRELFARAEHQTLRFRRGDHSYLVHSFWSAPSGGSPESVEAGVIVMRGDRVLRELRCRNGRADGDMREYPIFQRLPQEPRSPLPERD